jgi:SPP1 family predicted phage head-tail adaptor
MRAGKLDRTISIDRYSAGVPDDFGTVIADWTPLATVRAQLVQASTEEFLSAQGANAETAVIFRTRWIAGLTTADRVRYDGRSFNIRETKELGRRRGLELRCEAAE